MVVGGAGSASPREHDVPEPEGVTLDVLRGMAQAVRPGALAVTRSIPVLEPLRPLLPRSELQRGTVVALDGDGATSLALALAVESSLRGGWTGFVDTPTMGWGAVVDAGVDPTRTIVLPQVPPASWAIAVASLVDAVDLVVLAPAHRVGVADGRRLTARVRERGAVLLLLAPRHDWPSPPDLRLTAAHRRWKGLGRGHGRLAARSVTVQVGGRRGADRPRRARLWLPSERAPVQEAR